MWRIRDFFFTVGVESGFKGFYRIRRIADLELGVYEGFVRLRPFYKDGNADEADKADLN